jgi:hypothetical protein
MPLIPSLEDIHVMTYTSYAHWLLMCLFILWMIYVIIKPKVQRRQYEFEYADPKIE